MNSTLFSANQFTEQLFWVRTGNKYTLSLASLTDPIKDAKHNTQKANFIAECSPFFEQIQPKCLVRLIVQLRIIPDVLQEIHQSL